MQGNHRGKSMYADSFNDLTWRDWRVTVTSSIFTGIKLVKIYLRSTNILFVFRHTYRSHHLLFCIFYVLPAWTEITWRYIHKNWHENKNILKQYHENSRNVWLIKISWFSMFFFSGIRFSGIRIFFCTNYFGRRNRASV